MQGFIDIEYETLKKALEEIETKKGICKVLPSARFTWTEGRPSHRGIQVSNHMPNIGVPDSDAHVTFEMLICDRLDGASTGTSASICKNCTLKSK